MGCRGLEWKTFRIEKHVTFRVFLKFFEQKGGVLNPALRPIYTVRFLLTIVACDFYSGHCARHGKIVYDFHDIKLPVATIVVGF